MATPTKTTRSTGSSSRKTSGRPSSRSNGASAKRSSRASSSPNGSRGLADVAAKAKVPLIAGAAAAAGIVGGVVAGRRSQRANGPLERLRHVSPPKLDLDAVKSAGERMATLGQQTADAASAVERVRSKRR
jgi:hypothetical protein